jgi:ABC-type bacteriocin/lantibiotic exporter with double-glycine peptidase domain
MIALVRALLAKPRLLLLDEALTSLPEDCHLQILKGIRQLGVNLILIQHGTSKVLANLPTVQIHSIQSS